MTFIDSVKTCMIEKYATFSGRASRSEFWWFFLFQFIIAILVDVLFGQDSLANLIFLAFVIPSLAAGCRRLHDTGRSGWWQLLALTGIGYLVLIYFWVLDSKPEGAKFEDARHTFNT